MKYYLKVLQNYANFNGRARRAEYWYFVLFNVIFAFAAMFLDNVAGLANDLTGYGPIYGLYALFAFLPGLAVGVRRMHDVGKSGWFILIPIYNFILAVTAGDSGENEYGPDPKEQSSSDLLDA
jgi:uncharacterized membrane protein YhaH (DUF805 family)